jgi:hypothetical protein
VTARSISPPPERATVPSDRPVAGSMLSYTVVEAADWTSMNDSVMVTVPLTVFVVPAIIYTLLYISAYK